jgi:predicted MFS family arabinose efflux permease
VVPRQNASVDVDELAVGPPISNRRSALAVGVLFFVNGMTFSNWLPRIPEIRDGLGLGNAGLGATLLGGGLGGIIGALLVGRVAERLGSKGLLLTAAGLLSVGLPMIAFVPAAFALLLVLTVLGTLDVFNDVAMNAQGVTVQQRLGRSIMNRLHAMWSLGFTAGALIGSGAAAAGVGVGLHLTVVGAVLLSTVLVVQRWLIAEDPPVNAVDTGVPSGSRRLSGVVVMMAAAALAAAALEATPNEWASVMMRDVFDAGDLSGFGTVACAGAMLLGRLGGDHVLDRIGERRLLTGALGLAAAGTLVTVVAPVTAVALVGLAIWGLGLSVVFPQLYATAARLPGTSAGAGMGSMLFGQRLGTMVTAVSVGALSQWTDLRVAFAVVGGIAVTILIVTVTRMTAAADPRASIA